MSNKTHFRVIQGGLAPEPPESNRIFHDAWVTNTRLMGVVCLGIHWTFSDAKPDWYQYLYFDAEEYGLERYESYHDEDPAARMDLEASLIGGLGGRKVALSEAEAYGLAQKFIGYNQAHNIEMPEQGEELYFLRDMRPMLSEVGEQALFAKMCVPITSPYMLANYFLMRCFGCDQTAATYLAEEDVDTTLYKRALPSTFYRNTVRLSEDHQSCRCESLVEMMDGYHIIVSELEFHGRRINGFRSVSDLPISDREAYLNLIRSEFVTVYQYDGSPEDFQRSTTNLTQRAMIHPEHFGRTFMLYHPNNEHVDREVYHLNDDLIGVYHMNDSGQLLAVAPDVKTIRRLELDLHFSNLAPKLLLKECYEFTDAVLLPYLESDIEDFRDFVNLIKSE